MKLLEKYDLVMREYLTNIQDGPTYLSPTIQNEFRQLLDRRVKSIIVEEVETAKSDALILDNTPDQSHIDQMS